MDAQPEPPILEALNDKPRRRPIVAVALAMLSSAAVALGRFRESDEKSAAAKGSNSRATAPELVPDPVSRSWLEP